LALSQSIIIAQVVTKTGTTAAKFLSIGVGPRANAMGSAFSAIADDATAMYWNPAGIAQVDEYQAVFNYTSLFADLSVNYFGIVIPAGDFGNWGVNVTILDIGEMEVTTENYPEGTGEYFSAASYAFGLSYARYITNDFIVGVNLKYVREDIYNSSADGFCIDIGTIFTTPFYGIKFASTIANYGTKMQMTGEDLLVRFDQDANRAGNNDQIDAYLSTDKFELPLRLQIGLSRSFEIMENQTLTLAVDATYPNDNAQWINIGGELSLFNGMVDLRGGYKTLFLDDSQEGLTLGFGVNYDRLAGFNIAIDYSYQQLEFLSNTHCFGVLLGF
ncbi:PorV/PorQ family protein, partial [Bacteroidota bacterium]